MPICETFMRGLDDGPWLPGCKPRKRVKAKTRDELREIRKRAWETRRRASWGACGACGSPVYENEHGRFCPKCGKV